ncbi:Rieske 2Fe-2S domain-containing protein [Edaphosphingomonas haloaromaticamans]|uniref:3-ketosteroid-9-alpha-monooxygenase oxygenase subunit n=1 Tax=Edaphosphingomonas haloaromaticamans TaxID=653954 RepID=A0A1S1HC48_9SPHN|nr:Rieske 2Fe-2S domain-containing protein [Sphingomonas haloaromaticamans]OHT19668.1 3-ketosteroid-9-alpha-monooxygenase oxygenase subunit [Sphingomonas haloaromaticamans]
MLQRFPMTIPFGWFFVSYSDELAIGAVRPIHYFGRDLVLFRGESGAVGLLDAYCPHLGAHMGHGGTVEGDCLRCPFHHWAYRPDGFCADIPYARLMPPITRREPIARPYPVVEKNGVVWAWYHPDRIAPTFDVIEHAPFTDSGWSPPVRRFWSFASNPQEIAENGVDFAHFEYVHKMEAVPEGKTTYDGHIRRSSAHGERVAVLPDGTTRIIPSSVNTIQNGAGQKFTQLQGVVTLSLMVLATPVEADQVELRFCFTFPETDEGSPEHRAALMAIEYTCGQTGVEGDIPIWHHKIHRAQPLLCDGDGPILRFRHYFQQFYAGEDAPQQMAAG